MNLLRLVRRRHLAMLWASQVLSAMGNHLYDLAVVWVAVEVAGSGAGLVVAANAVTRLTLGIFGGVLADRWDRHSAMIAADLLRAAVVAVLSVIAQVGELQLWYLAVASVALAALDSLFNPALLGSLPQLVRDRKELQALIGLMDGTWRLALALAPATAGLLVAVLPLPQFFTLDALSFVASAGAIAALGRYLKPRPDAASSAVEVRVRRSLLGEALGAVSQVRAIPLLNWYIPTVALNNLAWTATFRIGLALLAAREVGGGVGGYGLLMGAYGVGNILSNLVLTSITIQRPALVMLGARFVLGSGFALASVAPTLPIAMLGTAIAAVGGPMGDITVKTVMQHELPPGQIGKAFSLNVTAEQGGAAVGLLLAAPLFALLGPRGGIAACTALMVATGIGGIVTLGRRGLLTAPLTDRYALSAQRSADAEA